jgi:hypothetical protein
MKKSRSPTPREVEEIIARGRKLVALANEKMEQFKKELAQAQEHTAQYVDHLRKTKGEAAVREFEEKSARLRAEVEAEVRREWLHDARPGATPGMQRGLQRGVRV